MPLLQSKSSKTAQIRRELENHIRLGIYPHGELLPPESEIARKFNAGRNTVRKALAELTEAGLLIKQQGRPSKVHFHKLVDMRSQRNRLAWFYIYNPVTPQQNFVYFDLYQKALGLAMAQNLQIDLLNANDPGVWYQFVRNQELYAGVFAQGVTEENCRAELFSELCKLPNLIDLDDAGTLPGKFLASIDHFESACYAAKQLFERGYRNVHFIHVTQREVAHPFRERQRGFERALAEAGCVTLSKYSHVWIWNQAESIFAAVERNAGTLLHEADALFCSTDELALAILEECRREEIDVPGRLAVLGFDGSAAGQNHTPILSTLQQPCGEIAATALRLAQDIRENPKLLPRKIRIRGVFLPGATIQ